MRSVPFHSTLSRHGKTRARSVLRMACRKRCILLFTLQQDVNARFNIIKYAENGGYPPTQNGDIRSLFWLFSLMALQN